ncbi:MAG: YhbY family RNA-binding protein [Erysipelotrichaceae bacterium]|nr:YhbY family RNA-binding protein [Erysipelotrichaceae bacterium]
MIDKQLKKQLKAAANGLKPLYQIGKNEISDNTLELLKNGLRSRELIKISVLKSVEASPQQLGERLATLLEAELVQVIGRVITLYKLNPQIRKYER